MHLIKINNRVIDLDTGTTVWCREIDIKREKDGKWTKWGSGYEGTEKVTCVTLCTGNGDDEHISAYDFIDEEGRRLWDYMVAYSVDIMADLPNVTPPIDSDECPF